MEVTDKPYQIRSSPVPALGNWGRRVSLVSQTYQEGSRLKEDVSTKISHGKQATRTPKTKGVRLHHLLQEVFSSCCKCL